MFRKIFTLATTLILLFNTNTFAQNSSEQQGNELTENSTKKDTFNYKKWLAIGGATIVSIGSGVILYYKLICPQNSEPSKNKIAYKIDPIEIEYDINGKHFKSTFSVESLKKLKQEYFDKKNKVSMENGGIILLNAFGEDVSTISYQLTQVIDNVMIALASTATTFEGAVLYNYLQKNKRIFNNIKQLEQELTGFHAVQGEHACYSTLEATQARGLKTGNDLLNRQVLFEDFQKTKNPDDIAAGIYLNVPLTRTCDAAKPANTKLTTPEYTMSIKLKEINQVILAAKDLNPAHKSNKVTPQDKKDAPEIIKGMIHSSIYVAITNNSPVLVLPLLGANAFKNEASWTIDALCDPEINSVIKESGLKVVVHAFSKKDSDTINSVFKSKTTKFENVNDFGDLENKVRKK